MKKICIAIGLIMAINTSWAQVSVDDDNFAVFVKAQNESRREIDSINNLELLSRVAKFDSVKVVEVLKPTVKPIVLEIKKPVEKPKVIKKETTKYVTVKTETNIEVETPKPIRQPLNQCYIEDNYQITGKSVFSENRLVGVKFETILRDKSYFLLKLVKKDFAIEGNRISDYFIGTYFVPYSWWNQNNTGSLTYEQVEYIKDNFQIKYKNEN